MNRKIYKRIARMYGVDTREVKNEITSAIKLAYINPSKEALAIPRKGTAPSPDELVKFATTFMKTYTEIEAMHDTSKMLPARAHSHRYKH